MTLLEILLGFDRAQAIEDPVCCVEQAVAFRLDALKITPFRPASLPITLLERSGNLSFVFHVLAPFV
jgi:hypothetical protein